MPGNGIKYCVVYNCPRYRQSRSGIFIIITITILSTFIHWKNMDETRTACQVLCQTLCAKQDRQSLYCHGAHNLIVKTDKYTIIIKSVESYDREST